MNSTNDPFVASTTHIPERQVSSTLIFLRMKNSLLCLFEGDVTNFGDHVWQLKNRHMQQADSLYANQLMVSSSATIC